MVEWGTVINTYPGKIDEQKVLKGVSGSFIFYVLQNFLY